MPLIPWGGVPGSGVRGQTPEKESFFWCRMSNSPRSPLYT
jgi:hypothetical protein